MGFDYYWWSRCIVERHWWSLAIWILRAQIGSIKKENADKLCIAMVQWSEGLGSWFHVGKARPNTLGFFQKILWLCNVLAEKIQEKVLFGIFIAMPSDLCIEVFGCARKWEFIFLDGIKRGKTPTFNSRVLIDDINPWHRNKKSPKHLKNHGLLWIFFWVFPHSLSLENRINLFSLHSPNKPGLKLEFKLSIVLKASQQTEAQPLSQSSCRAALPCLAWKCLLMPSLHDHLILHCFSLIKARADAMEL